MSTPAPSGTAPAPATHGTSRATGPRAEHGKAVAARNATTHALFARDIVLPDLGEDPRAFDALLKRLCEQLPPRSLLERHHLEQIAAAAWRLRRLHRWQAQIYEDEALPEDQRLDKTEDQRLDKTEDQRLDKTEDQRLDKTDKTLRHETTLTRQIDRAVRTLNRDCRWLFEGRARDAAHYQRDLTPEEVRAEPELGIEGQRDIWRRLRPAADADLAAIPLDNVPHETEAPPPSPP